MLGSCCQSADFRCSAKGPRLEDVVPCCSSIFNPTLQLIPIDGPQNTCVEADNVRVSYCVGKKGRDFANQVSGWTHCRQGFSKKSTMTWQVCTQFLLSVGAKMATRTPAACLTTQMINFSGCNTIVIHGDNKNLRLTQDCRKHA